MKEDLAENYSILKWFHSQTSPRLYKRAFLLSLGIFTFIFLTEYMMTLGDQRVVLEQVELSKQSNYDAVHRKVSVVENAFGQPVLIIEKKFNIIASFLKGFLMSLFAYVYTVTRRTETEAHATSDEANA